MLYKNELSLIEPCGVPKVDKEYTKGMTYVANVKFENTQRSGKVIVVDFYNKRNKKLVVRFFSDGDKYITFDVDNNKWCRSYVSNVLYPNNERCNYNVYCSDSKKVQSGRFLNTTTDSWCYIEGFGGGYSGRCLSGILGITDRFIQNINREAKERADYKANKAFDERRSWFPKPNKQLDNYCNRKVFSGAYIFYSTYSNKIKSFSCSSCGKKWLSEEKAKHKALTTCPKCKASATWIRRDLQHVLKESATICDAYDHNQQLILRWQTATRTFCGDKPHIDYADEAYTFYLIEKGKPKVTSYFYSTAYMGGAHWTKARNGETCYHPAYIYTDNLKDVFGPKYYNVDLSVVLKKQNKPLNFIRLLDNLKSSPATEYLCKIGLVNLAAELRPDDFMSGNNFETSMGVPRSYIEMYRKLDISADEHRLLQGINHYVSTELFMRFKSMGLFSFDYKNVVECCKHQRLDTLCDYIERLNDTSLYGASRVVSWLKDYYDMCDALEVPITKTNVRPRELKKSHDLLVERYNKVKAAIKDAKSKAALELVNNWFKGYEKDGLCILVPQYESDFIREGQALNHCVGNGSYYKKHITGEKMIFFIRKTENEKVPYFTAEIDMVNNKVLQCYGKGDCRPTNNVDKFIKEFNQWLKYQSIVKQQAC